MHKLTTDRHKKEKLALELELAVVRKALYLACETLVKINNKPDPANTLLYNTYDTYKRVAKMELGL